MRKAERRGSGSRRRHILFGMLLGAMTTLVVVAVIAVAGSPIRPPDTPAGRAALGEGLPGAGLTTSATPSDVAALTAEAVSLRATIAAEEARLNALRQARDDLETEIEELRRQATEAQQRLGRFGAPAQLAQAEGEAQVQTTQELTTASLAAASPGVGSARQQSERQAREASIAVPAAQVFVHHRAGSNAAERSADEIAGALREAGFEIADIRSVPFVPSTRVVRYFHSEDAEAAARIAGRLGRGWAIQDFRAYSPQPPPQTLEIWLPER